MDLASLKDLWDQHGRADAMWAVVSDPRRTGRSWDVDAFFEGGRRHADDVMARLERNGLSLDERSACLDFGCGVGRVARNFAPHFDHVVGVDIAPSMIELARTFSPDEHLEFVVNDRDDLSQFPDDRFDFVHSIIVLQHIPGEACRRYIAEFVRVLKPGGLAVFQVPDRERPAAPAVALPPEAFSATLEFASPPPPTLRCGEATTVEVRIVNTGTTVWPARVAGDGPFHLRVGNHWRRHDGHLVVDDGRSPLGHDVLPGAASVLGLTVVAPGRPGAYDLMIDLVQEGESWFADRGNDPLTIPVKVSGRRLAERVAGKIASLRGAAKRGPAPEPFGMYAVPRPEVEAIVTAAGGEVVAVEEDAAAGPDWISYTYFVRAG